MSAECQSKTDESPKSGLFRRFSRSSSRSVVPIGPTVTKASPDAVATSLDASPTSLPGQINMTAFAKLRSQLGRRGKKSRVDFPPSSWDFGRTGSRASTAATSTPNSTADETAKSTSVATPDTSPSESCDLDRRSRDPSAPMDTLPNSETRNPGTDDSQMMSAATLARRIHSLLSSVPPFFSASGSVRLPKASSDRSEREPEGGPPLSDSKLLSLLSSASAMNGSISKGRESVWAILERLGYSQNPKSDDQEKNGDASGASSSDNECEVSSVMICCPLEPTEDTEVELARSEIVSIDMDKTNAETHTAETSKGQKAGLDLWPFGKGKGKEKPRTPTPEQPKSTPKVKEVRVWFPSRTKVSLQAAWWGYRIYLPPPVMRVLGDKSLEAAKRAAMITAALTWLVSHIPTAMLPPQLKAVVGVVKGIVPIVGYVGGFIAWSWSTVQNFDKGQGVILSATWLLPIALVPGTWHYTEPPPVGNGGNSSGTTTPTTPPIPPPKDSPGQPLPSASIS